MNLDRINAAMIVGSRIWICRIGTTTGSEPANTVSDSVLPELPESYATPGDWVSLGKIKTWQPQTEFKTADAEGVDDTGAYKVTELKLATKRKMQFTTNDITPEAWELTFGLKEQISSGGKQSVFASGNDTIEVWLVVEITDAYRTETNLARAVVRGKLSLQNPLDAKSDPAEAQYELSVVSNPLAEFTENALVGEPVA